MVFELFKEYSTVETFTGRPILGQDENPTKNEKIRKYFKQTNNLSLNLIITELKTKKKQR